MSTIVRRVLVAVVAAMLCTDGADALRCNGAEDNTNCGSDNMPKSFCDASVFSSSLNEKLTDYTRKMCPVMCGTCQTTTSTTTFATTWAPTEAVKVTPKQSVAIIGLCFAPILVLALACYYKEERIPMSVMKHVMSESLEVAINRRLHSEGKDFAAHRGPVRASVGDGKPKPAPPGAKDVRARGSVSELESGDDADAFSGAGNNGSSDLAPARRHSQERIARSKGSKGSQRPSFEYARPKQSPGSTSPVMLRPSGRSTIPDAHPGGAAHEVTSLPPSKPRILGNGL